MNNENVFSALGIFLEAMRLYTVRFINKYYPDEDWETVFFDRLAPAKQTTWLQTRKNTEALLCIDYSNLAFLPSQFRDELVEELGNKSKTYQLGNILTELQEARNKCQHFNSLDADAKDRTFSNMIEVANMLDMKDLADEIKRLRSKTTAIRVEITPDLESEEPDVALKEIIDDGKTLPSWFNNCLPHYDIRNGNLDESVFAANLNEVALGTGPEVYNNPTTFFSKTYVTSGLRDIANRVIKALNGEETENRVISLQTGFGGGKTHTLISIYHIVKSGARLLESETCAEIMQKGVKPKFDNAKVVVFTNNTTDVSQGRQTPEGITIYTLWGEIAYQLGGIEGYEQVKANDNDRIAPSSTILKPIIEKAGVSLILIDELADYCVKASAKKVGGGNLYNQTNSFIQTLTEVVSSIPRCVLIATLPASKTEVADSQIGQEILDSLHERIVRIGTNVKPVDDEEVFEVVRRRLFEQINDTQVVELVAKRYKDMFHNRKADLPEYCDKMEYAKKIKKSYPFHPELIEMFRQRWGSDSRFQRTRGVLRLLASIIQDLWKRKDSLIGSQALIHTSDVNLENLSSLTGTITNLMGSPWETVMLADVYGSSSNARKIDDLDPQSGMGQYRLTQGIATTLLMASVGAKLNKGLDIKQLKLCVLKPKAFNHNDVDGSLNKLEQVAHYLYSSKVGIATYWFESKANVNILLSQARSEVKQEEAYSEILRRLKPSASFIHGFNCLINPTGDIPEQKTLTLAIMHPQYTVATGGKPSNSLERVVSEIALKRGSSDRVMRNTIFYLACSEAGRSALVSKLYDYLACNKILNEYGNRLEKDQNTDVQNRKREYDNQVSEALIRAYNVAVRYSAKEGIKTYELKNYASDFSTQLSRNLIDEIKEEDWLIASIGRNALSKAGLMPTVGNNVRIKDIYEAFLRFDDKPMITGQDAVKETVNRFCSNNTYNVGVGKNGNFTKIYVGESVPYLDVTNEDYWLLDPSVVMETQDSEPLPGSKTDGNPQPGPGPKPLPPKPLPQEPTIKEFSEIIISGNVPLENYSQLFTSFIQILKNNRLKIEIKFSAKSTDANPLTENSATFKSVENSVSQLGLNLETKEK